MSGWENPLPSMTAIWLHYVKFRTIFSGICSTQSFDSCHGKKKLLFPKLGFMFTPQHHQLFRKDFAESLSQDCSMSR